VLRLLELKDPGAVFELVVVMELGLIRGAIEPHFVDNLEPAVGQWLLLRHLIERGLKKAAISAGWRARQRDVKT
jgi:hypothetical protein